MLVGFCHVCGGRIESTASWARRVAGWEVVRGGGGGANRIVERVELGQVAHKACVEQRARARRHGINDRQETLS